MHTKLLLVGLLLNPVLQLSQEVPAGNVLAIGGLDTAILKSATLADSSAARPLAPMLFQVSPTRTDAGPARSVRDIAYHHWYGGALAERILRLSRRF